LEEVMRALAVDRQVAQLINEQGVVLLQAGDLAIELAFHLGQLQGLDEADGGGEQGVIVISGVRRRPGGVAYPVG
jgi:hypothetical protein